MINWFLHFLTKHRLNWFGRRPLKRWFIIIFAPPGNGKSLEQARISEKCFQEYRMTETKYPELPHRYLLTNQTLDKKYICEINGFSSEWYDEHYVLWKEVDDIRYCHRKNCWKGTGLHKLHDCDLFCDEGAGLFPATAKGAVDDMPRWLKKLVEQHRHNGIRILLLTIDFQGINITARRCVWDTWYMRKTIGNRDISATLPAPRFIWGIYSQKRIDPKLVRSDNVELLIRIQTDKEYEKQLEQLDLIGWTRYRLITRHKTKLYDTTQDIADLEVKREIEHIEVPCKDPKHPNCGYKLITHKLK